MLHCPNISQESSNSLACLGVSAIYRMGVSLAILFGIILGVCCFRNETSKFVNENFWFHKMIGLMALFISQMWIPNDLYLDLSWIA